MNDDRLIGTWKLVDFRLTDAEGNETHPWADGADGCLIYAADGYMSAATYFPDGSGSRSMFYCGPYEALGDKNIHHIELSSDPMLVGTDQHRLVRFEGDTMVLTASPSIAGGPGSTADIVWKRV